MKKVIITTDCVCDMSEELLEQYDVRVIYFYITTEHGWFKDREEITSGNIVEYFERGGKEVQTKAPFPEEYEAFFERILEESQEIIHIAVTSTLSKSCENALVAAKKFNGRVYVVDSGHLSTGMAHLIIHAVKEANAGKTSEEIIAETEAMKKRVSTSFIAENANYLYRTDRVSKFIKNMCETFRIHPVLGMKNGVMSVKGIRIGAYEKAVVRYVRKEMRRLSRIDKERLFITHTKCSLRVLNAVKKQIGTQGGFRKIYDTEASATISSNCGANTIGVLYLRK